MTRLQIAVWIAAAGIAGSACSSHRSLHFSPASAGQGGVDNDDSTAGAGERAADNTAGSAGRGAVHGTAGSAGRDAVDGVAGNAGQNSLGGAAGSAGQASGTGVVDGTLGSEPGQFGVQEANESMPEAPMSIASSADGETVYVLDQLNARIQIFAGDALKGEIPIESRTAEDVVVVDTGALVLLDRVADRFWVLTEKGITVRSSPVTGTAVREAGAVLQMFARPDGVWIKTPQSFIHALDSKGQPLEPRTVRQGFPSFDGDWLYSVRELGDRSVEVTRRPAEGMPSYQQRHLTFDESNRVLLWSELDGEGNLYLAWRDSSGSDDDPAQGMMVLSPALETLREFDVAPDASARNSYRTFAVSQGGTVFQLDVTDERVRVRRF